MNNFFPKNSIYLSDQTTPIFHYIAMNEINTNIVLTKNISIDDIIIEVSENHGIVVNNWLVISDGSFYDQCMVTNVNGNNITLCVPFARNYLIENTKIIHGSINMNINGSINPITFKIKLSNSLAKVPVDIVKLNLIMTHSTEANDSKFGGLPALNNGVFIRYNNHTNFNLANFKINNNMRLKGWDVEYSDKAGNGLYSTNATLNLSREYGVVIRLKPQIDDISIVIRDNLTGLQSLNFVCIGHYTEGEL